MPHGAKYEGASISVARAAPAFGLGCVPTHSASPPSLARSEPYVPAYVHATDSSSFATANNARWRQRKNGIFAACSSSAADTVMSATSTPMILRGHSTCKYGIQYSPGSITDGLGSQSSSTPSRRTSCWSFCRMRTTTLTQKASSLPSPSRLAGAIAAPTI